MAPYNKYSSYCFSKEFLVQNLNFFKAFFLVLRTVFIRRRLISARSIKLLLHLTRALSSQMNFRKSRMITLWSFTGASQFRMIIIFYLEISLSRARGTHLRRQAYSLLQKNIMSFLLFFSAPVSMSTSLCVPRYGEGKQPGVVWLMRTSRGSSYVGCQPFRKRALSSEGDCASDLSTWGWRI